MTEGEGKRRKEGMRRSKGMHTSVHPQEKVKGLGREGGRRMKIKEKEGKG